MADGEAQAVYFDVCVVFSNARAERHYEHFVRKLHKVGLVYEAYSSIGDDETYVRIGATVARLKIQADLMDLPIRLDEKAVQAKAEKGFTALGISPIVISTHMPDGSAVSRFRAYECVYGKYDNESPLVELYANPEMPFTNSMLRIKLLWAAITVEEKFGGAETKLERMVQKGRLLAALVHHDAGERNALYQQLRETPVYHAGAVDLDSFKDYFGEKQALLMAFIVHNCTWYIVLGVVGVAVQIWTIVEGRPFVLGTMIYAACCVLWAVCVTEFWKRQEKCLALKWGMVGFEARELRRPQFVGTEMLSPVTGRPDVYFPQKKRTTQVYGGVVATALFIAVDYVFLGICIGLKQNDSTAFLGILLNAIGIVIFMYAYQILAVKLTNAENWQTDTQFSDKLVFKLCTFNFINSYSPLFYGVFAAQDRCGSSPGAAQGDASACFYDLRYNMIVIFIVAVLSNNVLAYAVPYLSMFRNRLREQGGFSAKAMSPPELEFLMSEYDETLDNITAFQQQAVQYGYVALFSAAFPAAPLLAALNNSLLARMDVYKFLNTYRRIRPFGAEDIGTYQSIFEGLNLAGALSNAGIIVFATPVKVHFSKYNRTVLWICLVTAYFAIVTVIQVALPDVDPDATRRRLPEIARKGSRK